MRVITEQGLKAEFVKNGNVPEEYIIGPEDRLTPSASDYLSVRHIRIVRSDKEIEMSGSKNGKQDGRRYGKPVNKEDWETPSSYKILYTGETVTKKPEVMTHLFENVLVYKDDKRIILRGKLDSFQATIIETQVAIECIKHHHNVVSDLSEILDYTRKILGFEVLNKEMPADIKLLGFDEAQIRNISHNPDKYFNLKQMALLEYTDGFVPAKLNYLRALSREIELVAVSTYRNGDKFEREDIVQALNRLSSIFHIMMYRELSGGFKTNPHN